MRAFAMLVGVLLIGATAALGQHSHPVPALPGTRRALPPPLPAPPPPARVAEWTTPASAECGRAPTYALGAAEALQHRDHLTLTADQVRRLELLRDSAATMTALHLRLVNESSAGAALNLTSARPDLDAFAARLREAADHRIEADLASARFALQARAVLTAMQWEALARKASAAASDTALPARPFQR